MPDTASVIFTLPELWLIRSVLRHEIPNAGNWLYPPANVLFNDAIAEAILVCTDQGQPDAALLLSYGDCLALDYTIDQEITDCDGKPTGKTVLLKSFRARAAIRCGYPDAPEVTPMDDSKAAVAEKLRSASVDSDFSLPNWENEGDQ